MAVGELLGGDAPQVFSVTNVYSRKGGEVVYSRHQGLGNKRVFFLAQLVMGSHLLFWITFRVRGKRNSVFGERKRTSQRKPGGF